ncbi:response regulator [Stappia sp.]|uniref:response regulator n=1 Tax=Stappia sp. TaxID=1870903 RepID=UPI003A998D2F
MGRKAKILCIEDERLLLVDLVDELTDSGYEVLAANNGAEAMELLKKHTPDLVLCDMMMPAMDGPQVLRRVREEFPRLSRMPFIFLTALATRDDIISGKRLGADDYLTKPIDFDLLFATIETRLSQVARIDGLYRTQLQKIQEAILKKSSSKGPVRISIVAGPAKISEPIKSALEELGCVVTLVSEETLKHSQADFSHEDLVFLNYSKIVHLCLKYIVDRSKAASKAKIIMLSPPNLTSEQKDGLSQTGVDGFIEYPYRPVEVFKQVMERLQPA